MSCIFLRFTLLFQSKKGDRAMKLDRLLGITTILLREQAVTAPALASRFEVSRRTIGRDIDALCQAGIPIITRQGAGGGIAIAQGYKLDKTVLTREELGSLIAALKGLGTVTAPAQVERTLDKLVGSAEALVSLPGHMVINLGSHYTDSLSQKIGLIRSAIDQCRVVSFDYYSEKGCSHRRVEPYFLAFEWEAWYLFAYCLKRHDFRLFKLVRLCDLGQEAQSYTPRAIPPERADLKACHTDHLRLTALFHPAMEYRLIESYGPKCYTRTPQGLVFSIGYTNPAFILSWLLGFGDRVKVLEPPDLAQNMCQVAENMAALYRE